MLSQFNLYYIQSMLGQFYKQSMLGQFNLYYRYIESTVSQFPVLYSLC